MSSVAFNSVHLNFSFDSDSLVSRIETVLYQWAKKDLSDIFDKVFEDCNVDDADLYLENIDFDLGNVPEGFFLSETCSRLKEKLEQFLYPRIESQRKSTYLRILINSCKKIAPEINASQVENIFYSVYQAEESKETVVKKVISVLKKKYPTLAFDEITEDIFSELNYIKGKKDNAYLLNVLEKIYFSFFQKQEESFIQSFLTSTVPQHLSDGYLDLLRHFVLEMQEKYPDLDDAQNDENLFFKYSDDKNTVDLKQILIDICATVLTCDSSAFVDDFIRRMKDANPLITTMGIIILFIDELKKKYPHLNDFRLSNFNEDKSPKLSKNYWKKELKELLWNVYKPVLQTEPDEFGNPKENALERNSENASISSGMQSGARDYNTEYIEVAEADVSKSKASEGVRKNQTLESEVLESNALEKKSADGKKRLSEARDSEKIIFEDDRVNFENTYISNEIQNRAELFNAEGAEIAEADVSKSCVFEGGVLKGEALERTALESDSLESIYANGKRPLSEIGASEKKLFDDDKLYRKRMAVSNEAKNNVAGFNAKNIENAKVIASRFNNSEAEDWEDGVLDRKSFRNKNQFSETSVSKHSISEDNKRNFENARVFGDVRDNARIFNTENDENAKVKVSRFKISEGENFENDALERKSSRREKNLVERRDSEYSIFNNGILNRKSADIFNDTQNKMEDADVEKFDKVFNECFAEFLSSKRKCSPLQITEKFISKLQKEIQGKNVFVNAVKAYRKATELEMKCNSVVAENDEILIKDAGLVLIGAYIPTLFKKLEYTTDGLFVSDQARLKACLLLRYIVFGDLPSDGFYFLANYFCGLPWNFRIPNDIVLGNDEKAIAESLIKSVIENWKAIGHVSIDGFRGTFLHRDGKIEKEGDDEICLKVKKGPFDMLLDKLPWSYSMLKFKWHKKLLSTTWR